MSGPEAKVTENVRVKSHAVESKKPQIAPLASHVTTVAHENARSLENHPPDFIPLASSDSPTLVGNPHIPVVEDGK